MLENPFTWVAVAFVVFVYIAYRPLFKAVGTALDKRSELISKELKEAQALKEEAAALLEKFAAEGKKTEEEAKNIIEQAKNQADRMIMEAQHQIEQNVKKSTQLAKQKIAQAELAVAEEIRNHAVEISISAARSLILEHIGQDAANDELVTTTIKQLNRKFH